MEFLFVLMWINHLQGSESLVKSNRPKHYCRAQWTKEMYFWTMRKHTLNNSLLWIPQQIRLFASIVISSIDPNWLWINTRLITATKEWLDSFGADETLSLTLTCYELNWLGFSLTLVSLFSPPILQPLFSSLFVFCKVITGECGGITFDCGFYLQRSLCFFPFFNTAFHLVQIVKYKDHLYCSNLSAYYFCS